jgi:hypothetical protein
VRPVRLLFAILAFLAAATPAGADETGVPASPAADYAVLSLLGDRLLVGGPLTSIGSRNSMHEFIELGDSFVEGGALIAAKEEIARLDPGATVALLRSRNPALFAIQDEMLDSHGGAQALADALRPRLEPVAAKRLLLVSKLRRDAVLHFADRYYDRRGRLEGLGFYTDRGMRAMKQETGEPVAGFIGFFAYFRLSLIDARTWRVVREVDIAESRVHGERDKEPWETLGAERKVKALQDLLREELTRALRRAIP